MAFGAGLLVGGVAEAAKYELDDLFYHKQITH